MAEGVPESWEEVLRKTAADPAVGHWIDTRLPIPQPFTGCGPIRLIVLGQDPTVQRVEERAKIKTVLNLDRDGPLRRYVDGLCTGLGLDLDRHVYATNLVKGFFVDPPTQVKELDLLKAVLPHWLPLLLDELSSVADAPVLSLGEPLLKVLVTANASAKVRDYWGYRSQWQTKGTGPLRSVPPHWNRLGRLVLPLPHQPSMRSPFWKEHMAAYLAFVRQTAGF